MSKQKIKKIVVALVAAAFLTGLCGSGILSSVSNTLADALYQKPSALDGNIVVVGIDQQSLDALGPFADWGRGKMAEAVKILNADPATAPAVIGLDVLYVGASADPAGDQALVEAAKAGGNLVVGAAATFDSELVTAEDGGFYMDDYAIVAFDEPYPELKEVAALGHLNAMFDKDGILRHGILQFDLQDGVTVPSLSYAVYQKYAKYLGEEASNMPPVNQRYHWYVPFSGLPGAYDSGYSFVDLLAGNLDPNAFAGKIVLIGPYAAGMQDDFATAIAHSKKMYGVEYQANMVEALLGGSFKQEVAAFPQLFAVFLLSFAAMLFFTDRKVLPATIFWLGLVGAALGICLFAYAKGFVLSPLYVPLAVTVLYVVTVAVNYIRSTIEKRHITNTFQRYVAPEIVGELLKEDSDQLGLGGKLCNIAVLFVDIRGFTTMSEVLEPAQIVEILNKYLTLTSQCIFQNNGTLDKFVGDCTMAFWGAPLPQDDCIFKAVKTGLDMIEGSKALSEELMETFGRTVNFGIGVHYGPAVVGNIGSPTRMDYTAIGDTVNTSARLEANAPASQLLVSRVVADALEGRVRFTSLGDTIKLKGKADGFEILRVEGLV